MRLHENREYFADAIEAAARPVSEGGLGIKSVFIEKDYWICRSLRLMAQGDTDNRTVFKGLCAAIHKQLPAPHCSGLHRP